MAQEKISGDVFDNKRNVTVGLGRIIYGTESVHGDPEGWVIPGGRRTSSYSEALLAAQWIDRYMRLGVSRLREVKKMPRT